MQFHQIQYWGWIKLCQKIDIFVKSSIQRPDKNNLTLNKPTESNLSLNKSKFLTLLIDYGCLKAYMS